MRQRLSMSHGTSSLVLDEGETTIVLSFHFSLHRVGYVQVGTSPS